MNDAVVKVESLWKRYGLPVPGFIRKGQHWLQRGLSSDHGRLTMGFALKGNSQFALQNLSFEVRRGETLGIIGRNGAGKSTLLKILAGVTVPTIGQVEVWGRVFPMIELNAGIHPELTGRENVRQLGAIMGMSRAEIEASMEQIEEFCELHRWFDKPVRMYSSGMLARLGFAVAVNVDAQVLLVDEVLAVGDTSFQRKCFERFEQLRMQGMTILIVSHDVRQIERMCDRALLMREGEIAFIGPPSQAVTEYFSSLAKKVDDTIAPEFANIPTTGELRVRGINILSKADPESNRILALEPFEIQIEIDVFEDNVEPDFVIAVNNYEMLSVFAFSSRERFQHRLARGRYVVRCIIPELHLTPGIYNLGFKVRSRAGHTIQSFKNYKDFQVVSDAKVDGLLEGTTGLAYTNHEWHFQRVQ